MHKASAFLLLFLVLFSFELNADWRNIRNSAVTMEENIVFRYESSYPATAEHILSAYEDNVWLPYSVDSISNESYETVIPFSNTNPLNLSFRIETEENILLIPGFSIALPENFSQMTLLSSYERDLSIPDHLNISEERMLFSEEQLFFSLSNFGGDFKVTDAMFGPFYSYTINLWPSNLPNPDFVYTLIYTIDLPPFISTGLYKIEAETEEMTKLAEIEHRIDNENNTLYLTCFIEDLMSDPDFSANYSPGSPLTITSLTQKIENLGQIITLMDEGNEHLVFLTEKTLHHFTNTLPEITNTHINQSETFTEVTLDYYDNEHHFPLIAEIILDGDNRHLFSPNSNDFSETVTFTCSFSEQWENAVIRFSDDLSQIIEIPLFNSVDDINLKPISTNITLYPNPFNLNNDNSDHLNLISSAAGDTEIAIFNIKGQLIYKERRYLSEPQTVISIKKNSFLSYIPATGFYFISVSDSKSVLTDKIMIIR